jgi:periplasmic copper chaperone A
MTPLPLPLSPAVGPADRLGRRLLLLALLGGALAVGGAARAAEPGLSISDAWMRFILPSRPAAGYFTLSNGTAQARALVGAASPACGMLMLHRSLHENGEDRMVMVKSVPVPAHGAVEFAPGGYHLMCMSPKGMSPGNSVAVTLRFDDGGTLSASFPVRNAAGK